MEIRSVRKDKKICVAPTRSGRAAFATRTFGAAGIATTLAFAGAMLGTTMGAAGIAAAEDAAEKAPPVTVRLPPPPNFNAKRAPENHPEGALSIFGLRKRMGELMEKDVRVQGYVVEIYECPADQRKCIEEEERKSRRAARRPGLPPAVRPRNVVPATNLTFFWQTIPI